MAPAGAADGATADPSGYGRIVRDAAGRVLGIVEHKDADAQQLRIDEVYTGMLAAPTAALKRWVMALTDDNRQHEYYLTDIVAMAVAEGIEVVTRGRRARSRCWVSTAPRSWRHSNGRCNAARPTS